MSGIIAISRHWDVPHGRDGGCLRELREPKRHECRRRELQVLDSGSKELCWNRASIQMLIDIWFHSMCKSPEVARGTPWSPSWTCPR